MTRKRKDPMRELKSEERHFLERVSRSGGAPAAEVARAKALLAVAAEQSYQESARTAGRKSRVAVSQLVSRFNRDGVEAIEPRHGGGPVVEYGQTERERILREMRRQPDREADGTATWSLKTLQRALRQAPDGLPKISTYTIHTVLREAHWSWQRDGSWCETGKVKRKRKGKVVEVTDPDTGAKKVNRASLSAG
jgi:transposase